MANAIELEVTSSVRPKPKHVEPEARPLSLEFLLFRTFQAHFLERRHIHTHSPLYSATLFSLSKVLKSGAS
ncbi:hypothetical protein L2E82_14611 [Cichorium intybus]|uniref:Uncharacterized protein n=1 Tax=Cichorium intybus TaxID=13427 RepID=A0ACB9F145_CICIN|nr:hypothetical protein L2E82_14611 [Cichorium intybus]